MKCIFIIAKAVGALLYQETTRRLIVACIMLPWLLIGCGSESDAGIVVLFGQSNAVGVKLGPEIGLQKVLKNAIIIKYAVGGTPLSCAPTIQYGIEHSCWLGDLLQQTVTAVKIKRAQLGYEVPISAYVFIQGEADANDYTTANEYYDNLQKMMFIIQNQLGHSQWAFTLLRSAAHRKGGKIVRKAISDTAKEIDACLEDLNNYESNDKGHAHLVPEEYVRLGKNIGKCLVAKGVQP